MIDKEMLVDQLNGMLRVRRKMGDMSNRQYDEVSSEINVISMLLTRIERGEFDIEVEEGYKVGSFCEEEKIRFVNKAEDVLKNAKVVSSLLGVNSDGVVVFGTIQIECKDDRQILILSNGHLAVREGHCVRAMTLVSDLLPSDYYDEFGVHTGR